MKIRFLTSIASASWSFAPGQVADLEESMAMGLVSSGIAEAVVVSQPETAAVKPSTEKAARTETARRKGAR